MLFSSFSSGLIDVGLLLLLSRISHPQDRQNPLASVVNAAVIPYAGRLYPFIVQTATHNDEFAHSLRHNLTYQKFEAIQELRFKTFESIMVYSVLMTLVLGGAYTMEGLMRSIREQREFTLCQARKRVMFPLFAGLMISMLVYNNLFEPFFLAPDEPRVSDQFLFLGMLLSLITLFLATLMTIYNYRKTLAEGTPMTEEQVRSVYSLFSFFACSATPLIYIFYQMANWIYQRPEGVHFMFSNYCWISRLVFLFAICLLDPYRMRFRCHRRCRTEGQIIGAAPNPGASLDANFVIPTTHQQAGPLPDKTMYADAPPSYEVTTSALTYEIPRPNAQPPTFDEATADKSRITPIV